MKLLSSDPTSLATVAPMATFKGTVRSSDLPRLVQFLSGLGQSGFLDLTQADCSARLAFNNGRIVAASCGAARGVNAIVELSRLLQEAEFVYAETSSPPEIEFNFSVDDLYEHFDGPEVTGPQTAVCPALGLVDDRRSYAGTATSLHRCFAFTQPRPVSSDEQRDVCLAGRYQSCPRFQAALRAAAENSSSVSPASLVPVTRIELTRAFDSLAALPPPQFTELTEAAPLQATTTDHPKGTWWGVPVLPALALALAAIAAIAWAYLLLAGL